MSQPRKYLHLIHKSIGKFPNWEPAFTYQLGDYGVWNKGTGLFDREGNIFTDGRTRGAEELEEVVEAHGGRDDFCTYSSLGTADLGANVGPSLEIPALAEATFKTNIQFGRSHGAVLFIHRPQSSRLERVQRLLESDYEHLRGKHLITQIVTGSAYFMYLSAKNSETLGVAFVLKLPVGAVAGAPVPLSAGGGVGGEWQHAVRSGYVQRASDTGQSYTPLLKTMAIGKKKWSWRDNLTLSDEEEGKDRWLISELPWDEEEEVEEPEPEREPVIIPAIAKSNDW